MSAATAGPTAASDPRRRLVLALLVVSVVLNLFFVAGAVWSRLHSAEGPNLDQRYQRMARELDLDPKQRAGFDKYVAAMRSRDQRMHQEIAPVIAGAWDEVAKPGAEIGQIMQRFDAASDKWRQFQREAMVQTLDFFAVLSPEQRARFIAIQRERRAAWLRRDTQKP
ncbi:MAG TPA: periplasmic heavy metal sensor [Stellaceae bacterium]|nr:periplasmic heavy metal sensor [Stellaceae bacterium]